MSSLIYLSVSLEVQNISSYVDNQVRSYINVGSMYFTVSSSPACSSARVKRPSVFIPDTVGASFDNYAVQFFKRKLH